MGGVSLGAQVEKEARKQIRERCAQTAAQGLNNYARAKGEFAKAGGGKRGYLRRKEFGRAMRALGPSGFRGEHFHTLWS